MKLCGFILLIFFAACTTPPSPVPSEHEVVQGYDGAMLIKAQKMIHGKSPKKVRKILGTPAEQGYCRSCGQHGTYKMIYLQKDMRRFYLELSYNTDQDIPCHVANFYYSKDSKKYLFDGIKGFEYHTKCNRY